MAKPRRRAGTRARIQSAFRRGELSWGEANGLYGAYQVIRQWTTIHYATMLWDYPHGRAGGEVRFRKDGRIEGGGEATVASALLAETFKERYGPSGIHADYNGYLTRREDGVWLVHQLQEMYRDAIVHSDKCAELDRTPAGAKAHELLFDHLTEEQQITYTTRGYFDVVRADQLPVDVKRDVNARAKFRVFYEGDVKAVKTITGEELQMLFTTRRYRICRGYPNGNVFMLTYDERPIANICLHPTEAYPNADTLLTQKLWIEANEAEFLSKGNFTPVQEAHLPRITQ